MSSLPRYKDVVADNLRWEHVVFRPGDIVITTPPKCGTTWTQQLCALLVLDTADFDRPLAEISPWVDFQTRPIDEVVAGIDAQTHRRILKSHTPLDGIPFDERVTYIGVGRDQRDVSLSWVAHVANIDFEKFFAARMEIGFEGENAADLELPEPPPEDPLERFWLWADGEAVVDSPTPSNLAGILRHLGTCWARRDEPNVELLHYDDLHADLPGQLGRLASALGIDRSPARIRELAASASFDAMRSRADTLVPDAGKEIFQDNKGFFRSGRSGGWREELDGLDLDRYRARVAVLAPPDLGTWMHEGWLGKGAGTRVTPPLRLEFVMSAQRADALPPTNAEVAFAGRSNVGKSSLINAIANRKAIAKVSNTPGRTQLLNLFAIDKGGTLMDLPGYGYAKVPGRVRGGWQAMIEGYLLGRENLKMIAVLVDGEIGPTKLDVAMLEWLSANDLPHAVIATKHDKVKSSVRDKRKKELAAACGVEQGEVAWVSAAKGTNIESLRAKINAWLAS